MSSSLSRSDYVHRSTRPAVVLLVGAVVYLFAALPALRADNGSAPPAPKAYIGLFKDNAIGVVDTATNRVLTKIPIAPGPHGLAVTPDGRWVYASSDGDSTLSVIDTATDSVTATIDAGSGPHGLAMTPDGRTLLVAVFGTGTLVFIDTATNRVSGSLPVPNPHNVAVSPDGRIALVAAQRAGSFGVVKVDIGSRSRTGVLPLDRTPRAIGFSPDGSRSLVSLAGSDRLQLLDFAALRVIGQIPVGASPHQPLFLKNRPLALVVAQGPGEIDLVDTSSYTEIGSVKVGAFPHWIGLSPDERFAYVSNEGSNDLTVVDLIARSAVATIPVGAAPRKLVVQPAASTARRTVISQFAFEPSIRVTAGSTVVWMNNDSVPHTVTADDRSWDSGMLAPGASFSRVFESPGTYSYHCAMHPFMQGSVTVLPSAA